MRVIKYFLLYSFVLICKLDLAIGADSPKKRERRERSERPDRYNDSENSSTLLKHSFEIELVKPYIGYDVQSSSGSGTPSVVNRDHAELGLRFTYAKIPKKRLGYQFGLAYIEYGGGTTSSTLRIEASGALRHTQRLYSYFGGHLQKFLNSTTAQIIDLGFGGQVGIGFHFNRKFGGKVGYTYTRFLPKTYSSQTLTTTISGPEFAFYYAF